MPEKLASNHKSHERQTSFFRFTKAAGKDISSVTITITESHEKYDISPFFLPPQNVFISAVKNSMILQLINVTYCCAFHKYKKRYKH